MYLRRYINKHFYIMLGAIIGDIVGSRFEFDNTDKYDFTLFTQECDFTDDTICTVAIADAILKGISYKDSILHWCSKYPNPTGGYGGSFAQWLHSKDHLPYDSFGNGSAMRVSPIGWAFNSLDRVMREAIESAKITHSHTEGLIGAQAVAMSIYDFRRRKDERYFCTFDRLFYGADWDRHLPYRGHFDVTCQGCVPLALHIISESTSFENAIRKAISYGGDSDTLGAIVGSVAEACFGIPKEIKAQALEYLPDDMKVVVEAFYKKYIGNDYGKDIPLTR